MILEKAGENETKPLTNEEKTVIMNCNFVREKVQPPAGGRLLGSGKNSFGENREIFS